MRHCRQAPARTGAVRGRPGEAPGPDAVRRSLDGAAERVVERARLAVSPVGRRVFALSCVIALTAVGWTSSAPLLGAAFGAVVLPEGPAVPVAGILGGLTVAIDPGHGGFDPGVLEGPVRETDINLAVSLMLRDILERAGAEVVLTRTEDIDLVQPGDEERYGSEARADLKRRLEAAEAAGADLFLSLHCNAFPSPVWRGSQTFYDPESRAGYLLAEAIQAELVRVTGETDRTPNGRIDSFLLKNAAFPAVIVELGFLSNPRDLELLQDAGYQRLLAMAVFFGICRFVHSSPAAAPAGPREGPDG